ncbi:elongation factor 1-delta-like isoform X1 [Culex pipiens pallens]|uniref:elongation factor 1-delta-like isoform X1 n=1 Tax=Culex pipiens pallens TaxID=42434 RepID=UPI001952CA45|nr:elongation factor 1-delta-like isoform X1 [Culex pipiens pallens]
MASPLACEKYWADKANIDGAEKKYYECLAQLSLNGNSKPVAAVCPKAATPQKAPTQAKQEKSPPVAVAPQPEPAAATADQAKVKKDKKRNKKNKKDASHSPDSSVAAAAATPVATPPEEPASATAITTAAGEQNKKKAKKNKKNNAKAGSPEVVAAAAAGSIPSQATNTKQLLTDSNKVQQENAKNLKEKENLAHKMCDNITEELSKMGSFPAQCTLASEISKARQHIKNSLERMDGIAALAASPGAELLDRLSTIEKENEKMRTVIDGLNNLVIDLHARIKTLEAGGAKPAPAAAAKSAPAPAKKAATAPAPAADDDDDDVDLFGSEDEDEDKAAAELREKRLAEYAAKKSKKPALIAKSNVILDIKPWDDETDMKQMELEVRKITMDGLLLGASKLVPLAYGIHKLQMSCVIEDDKVSVDELQEKIELIEDYVQSVDIAAFNKI